MGDIAQRGNKLTKKHISTDLVRNVYEHVARKHSLGQKGKPHSSKEGVTASGGRAVRDVGKIFGSERVGKFGGGRTNLLEELGRVEAEPSNRNRRAEISRVHGELNRGYNKGGRAGFRNGGSSMQHHYLEHGYGPHKKRKRKALGGVLHAVGKLAKKFKKKKVYPETEDLTHQKGPYVGDVGSEGKRRKAGPRGKGKSPGRPKAPGPKDRRPWRDAIPGRPRPGTPAPNWIKPKKYQPAAEGGRIGFKKGGSDKNWIQKAVNPKHKGYCTPMTKKTCTPRRKALARTFKKKAKTGWS